MAAALAAATGIMSFVMSDRRVEVGERFESLDKPLGTYKKSSRFTRSEHASFVNFRLLGD
jgi:hypothetical protein